jgi:Domain of unknown function (DUF4394)
MTLPEVEMRSVKAGVLALSLFAVGCTDRTSPTSETTGLEGIDGVDETTAPDAAAPSELGSAASTSSGGKVFGVDTENNLVVFNLDRPGRMNRKVRITGIGGQKILGIDFRPSAVAPATAGVIGKLYGITKTKVYEIDPGTGYASNGQSLTVPLVGVSFGTGFNPTVDRLRSHGNATQNVRLSVDNGLATQDTALAYAVGDPGFGTAPSIGGTAYTNSDNDPATGTVLYAIDARRDALAVLPSPNGGQLTTVGRLRVRTSNMIGFDIRGAVGTPFGYASLTNPDRRFDKWAGGRGGSTLYKVDLATGAARLVGDVGHRFPLVSIALAP